MLLLQLSETLQAPPALRDIRDGPVELLGQRFAGCKVAGHPPLSRRKVLPGEFLDCRHRSEHEQELQEGIQENRPAQGETGAGAGVRGTGRAGGSGEGVQGRASARRM